MLLHFLTSRYKAAPDERKALSSKFSPGMSLKLMRITGDAGYELKWALGSA
jgi:hypothetical protein